MVSSAPLMGRIWPWAMLCCTYDGIPLMTPDLNTRITSIVFQDRREHGRVCERY